MGACCQPALSADEQLILGQARLLDKAMKENQKNDQEVKKILLLGTGESGKSTIFKQMQILASVAFTQEQKTMFKHVLRRNTVECMQTLIEGAEKFEFDLAEDHVEFADTLLLIDPLSSKEDFWTDDCSRFISTLWNEEDAIIETFARRHELQLLDSAKYFFENVDRFGDPAFDPSVTDILACRLRTSGIVEKKLTMKDPKTNADHTFLFLDVGGQRNERRKWIHCFSNVTCILFVVAMSEYDQVLFEDECKNRMLESMQVWTDICSNETFFQVWSRPLLKQA
jgi:GTPase SAR1 family protein